MTTIQLRRDTEANWTSVNPTLALGEWGYDTTNKVCKIGDGTTPWNALPVYGGESELPIATDTTAGIVKPDGSTITVTADGTISATASGGTSDYTELTNKPKINSVELSGDKSASDLSLASVSDVTNLESQLNNKQDILTPINPLAIEEVAVTSPNNMTYSGNQGTVLSAPFRVCEYDYNPFPNTSSVPSGAGDTSSGYHIVCSQVSAFGTSLRYATYVDVTPGSNYAFINYQMSIGETAILLPINYFLGYFNSSGEFTFATSTTYARTTSGRTNKYRIMAPVSEEGLLPDNSYTTGICLSQPLNNSAISDETYYSITVEGNIVTTTWYDVDLSSGAASVTNIGSYALTNATVASLMRKVKCALYFPTTTEVDSSGNISKINPILNSSYEPIFTGQTSTVINNNNLKLNISATSGNALEIKDDGLYTSAYTLPTASTATLGGVKIDGTTITIANGVISAALEGYAQTSDIPTATSDLTNDSGFITNSVNNLTNYTLTSDLAAVATSGSYNDLTDKPTIPSEYVLPTASASVLGGVKIGNGVTVTDDGTISVASVNNFKFWSGTQTAYNGIATKDPNTLYIITG